MLAKQAAERVLCERGPGDRVRIQVLDSGPGIPEAQQNELFEPFNRLGRESGSIEGSGSCFQVELPIADGHGHCLHCESDVPVEEGG